MHKTLEFYSVFFPRLWMYSTPHLVSDTFPPSQVGPGGGYHIYIYTYDMVKNSSPSSPQAAKFHHQTSKVLTKVQHLDVQRCNWRSPGPLDQWPHAVGGGSCLVISLVFPQKIILVSLSLQSQVWFGDTTTTTTTTTTKTTNTKTTKTKKTTHKIVGRLLCLDVFSWNSTPCDPF